MRCGATKRVAAAGHFSFQVVPYGIKYFLRTAAPALPGTQLAEPYEELAPDGRVVAVQPQSNFTAAAGGGFWVTPSFVPKPGSTAKVTLLLQDTQVSTLLAPVSSCREPHASPAEAP